jgi:hypothetical protein
MRDRLGRVFFQINFNGFRDHFARRVKTAGRADMVRALFFAARRAVMRIFGDQKIVAATLPTTGFGDFILWDGHVATFVVLAGTWP